MRDTTSGWMRTSMEGTESGSEYSVAPTSARTALGSELAVTAAGRTADE